MDIKFTPYVGNMLGLPTNKNHFVYSWINPHGRVLFSMSQRGNAASCHVAADYKGKHYIKEAINEFVEFVFQTFNWCEAILAKITKKKIRQIVSCCGFVWAATLPDYTLYIRRKDGIYI